MNLNKLHIIGRVTKQPELKTFDSGAVLCSFSVATNHIYKNKDGEKVEETEFHNITAFGKTAETIVKYVVKGQELYVCGRLKTDTYEKEGQKHYSTKVILEQFQFGAKPKGTSNETGNKSGDDQRVDESEDGVDKIVREEGIDPEEIPF